MKQITYVKVNCSYCGHEIERVKRNWLTPPRFECMDCKEKRKREYTNNRQKAVKKLFTDQMYRRQLRKFKKKGEYDYIAFQRVLREKPIDKQKL